MSFKWLDEIEYQTPSIERKTGTRYTSDDEEEWVNFLRSGRTMTNEYLTLKQSMEVIKVYTESSHFDRKLMREKGTENLYLYEFYEYVNFNDGPDLIYETFTLVKDEEDAKILNKEKDIRRFPFIRVNPDYSIIKG